MIDREKSPRRQEDKSKIIRGEANPPRGRRSTLFPRRIKASQKRIVGKKNMVLIRRMGKEFY